MRYEAHHNRSEFEARPWCGSPSDHCSRFVQFKSYLTADQCPLSIDEPFHFKLSSIGMWSLNVALAMTAVCSGWTWWSPIRHLMLAITILNGRVLVAIVLAIQGLFFFLLAFRIVNLWCFLVDLFFNSEFLIFLWNLDYFCRNFLIDIWYLLSGDKPWKIRQNM